MIKHPTEVERAQRRYERAHPLTIAQKYALFNAMYEEARRLGRWKPRRGNVVPKHKLEVARILNARS